MPHRISFKYNIKAADRGPLIRSIEKATGKEARYLGAPRYEYEAGRWSIYRTGQIDYVEGWPTLEEVTTLLECLTSEGMPPENEDEIRTWISEQQAETTANSPEETLADGVTVTIPRDTLTDAALERFKALTEAKGGLIRAAMNLEALSIEVTDAEVRMPWIQRPCTPAEAHALTALIGAMLTMARSAKRVTAKPKEEANPRYAMRCFLLRLGFIGPEHKQLRKTLMGDLAGSAAWRTPPEQTPTNTGTTPAQPEENKAKPKPTLVGRRVRLDDTTDPYTTLPLGAEGTIDYVDDQGTLHVTWDEGGSLGLGLIPGEDSYTLL